MTSTVYITQQPGSFDYSQAEDFGRVVALWAPHQQAWGDTKHLADVARTKLANFNPDTDYLLPMGDPALMALAAAEVAFVTDGRFNLLKWDRRKPGTTHGGYRVVEIDVDGQPA